MLNIYYQDWIMSIRFNTVTKLILLVLTVSMCLPVQSLLAGEDTDNVSTGGFGEIVYKHGSFENESGGILGLRGAVIRNQKVNLGIGMYLLASEIESPYNSGNGRMIYGGLELGYIRDIQ